MTPVASTMRPLNAVGKVVRRPGVGRFEDDDDPVAPRPHLRAEGNDPPLPHIIAVGRGLFQVLRIVVPAVDDDRVLHAPADVQLAVCQVPEVAGVQPPAGERLAGERLTIEVPGEDGRSPQEDLPDVAFGQRVPFRIRNPDLVAGETAGRN